MNRLLFGLAVVLLLPSCDYLGDTSVWEAVLPGLPTHWRETFPALTAELVTGGADGSVVAAAVSPAALRFPVRLRKERNSLVLLYYGTGAPAERLRPYGAVFPAGADCRTHTLTLTAAGGFVAERLWRLVERGVNIESFNTERLLALISEKGDDPWAYDPLLLETRLAEGKFSVYALKKLPVRSVSLETTGGTWFNESPTQGLWTADNSGRIDIPELAFGFHTLYRRGSDERIRVSVGGEEVIVFAAVPAR